MKRLPRLVVVGAAVALLGVTGCSSGDEAGPASSAPAAVDPQIAALTAAGCGEITRLSREEMNGLADKDPAHWEKFAFALQSIADGAADADFGVATTAMATAALRTSEALNAGKPLGPELTAFEDTIPAVDSACKRVGAPLN